MIDWHSHILPGVDDGSRDVAESLSLLNELSAQGVQTVIATPHFFANDETVETFLERRRKALDKLRGEPTEDAPNILLGAEVKYYQGISRMADLRELCIEGTKMLLLEMPFSKWTEYTVRELVELAGSRNITVILAHIERYMSFQGTAVWNRLYESGLLMQVNASFFTGVFSRRRAMSLLLDGGIHFIGSDCHNMTSRPPRIGKAFEIIENKLGSEYLSQMNEYGRSVLGLNK